MNIHLHIDRIVLNGIELSIGQQHRLQASLTAELSQLIANGGIAPGLLQGGELPQLTAKGIQSTHDASRLGQSIARSVYGGIGRE